MAPPTTVAPLSPRATRPHIEEALFGDPPGQPGIEQADKGDNHGTVQRWITPRREGSHGGRKERKAEPDQHGGHEDPQQTPVIQPIQNSVKNAVGPKTPKGIRTAPSITAR